MGNVIDFKSSQRTVKEEVEKDIFLDESDERVSWLIGRTIEFSDVNEYRALSLLLHFISWGKINLPNPDEFSNWENGCYITISPEDKNPDLPPMNFNEFVENLHYHFK